jgi:predicted component of type VI protein secretion system
MLASPQDHPYYGRLRRGVSAIYQLSAQRHEEFAQVSRHVENCAVALEPRFFDASSQADAHLWRDMYDVKLSLRGSSQARS